MKIVKAYQCDYCQRVRLTKKVIEIHEKKCFHNPQTRSCATCAYKLTSDCAKGLNITVKLKTQCEMYRSRDEE